MKTIDLQTWPRKVHYELFRSFEYPHFSLTTEVDVSGLRARMKGDSFYFGMIHQVATAANAVEEFRMRIRGEQVVIHDSIDPSFTVPWGDNLFNFCTVKYESDWVSFRDRADTEFKKVQSRPTLVPDEPGRDDFLFITCLPWIAFTSMTHPVNPSQGDSVPRVAWGKFTERDGRTFLPLNFQVHHALVDGLHIAHFLENLQRGLLS